MRIAIVGGGMAGLFAARALREWAEDAELALFEAAPRLGGKVATHREGDWQAEEGPTAVSGAPDLQVTSVDAGLTPQMVRAPARAARFVFTRGKLVKAGPRLVSPFGLGRVALEPALARRAGGDESVLSFLTRHLGAEMGPLAARLFSNGVFAGDPARLGARAALPRMAIAEHRSRSLILGMLKTAMKPKIEGVTTGLWSFHRGLRALPEGLAEAVAKETRLGARVEGISPSGKGWDVAGHGRFDAVVLAVPGPEVARLARAFAPRLAELVEGVRYAPVTVVHAGYREAAFARPPQGFGLVNGEEDGALRLLGTLFPSRLFPGRAPDKHVLLTSMVGGARHPERAALADGELLDLVHADLARALGAKERPVWTRVVRHGAAIPQYEVDHVKRVVEAWREAEKLPPLALAGAAWHGVSVPDVSRSGTSAAEVVLARLQQG